MLYKYFPISSISDEDRQTVLNLHINVFRLRDYKSATDKKKKAVKPLQTNFN